MASAEADSRVALLLVPALEKIVKNASWRKGHSKLAHQCKSSSTASPPAFLPATVLPNSSSSSRPLRDGGAAVYSLADSETYLAPLVAACTSGSPRVAEPAIDCVQKLIAHSYLYGEADPSSGPDSRLLAQLVEAVCGCYALGGAEDSLELLVLKTLLSAVTSTALRIHGDSLLQIVRTCYDLYLSSKNPVNQATAKASLIQMLVIVFRRMEADSSTVPVQPIVVAELMEPADRSAAVAAADVNFVQGFITKIISDIDGVLNPSTPLARTASTSKHDGAFVSTAVENTNPADLLDSTDKDMLDAKYWEISMYKTALEGRKDELGPEGRVDRDDDTEVQIGNKLKRDAFLVFRALCKLSMKTLPKEAVADPAHMKGKIVALELLKILLENAGAVFRTSERFLGAIKQYLCLSLLKNSASAHLIVFQLSCSIFMSLVSRFRPGLKAEIGVFFPMIVLRVLENVAQPNFQQKMIDGKWSVKNCSRTSPRGSYNTDTTTRYYNEIEAMKCLVAILRSMGDWMNKQLRIPDPHSQKTETIDGSGGSNELTFTNGNGDETVEVSDSNSDTPNGTSEVASIEQRRAYKLELQEGISLFNQKPKKGIEFLINTKKREDLSLKVMHAYVDSFDFQGMEFDEAIRCFLKGFRLPGEAQKIDRIMEKFAERYCKCNPKAFTSADTAYVLAYSVILLNTDAHNPMVKNKMSPDDFIRNNRGIDDGKDLSEEYLRSLFDRISKNEIKMKEDTLALQQIQSSNLNRILGLDSILNIVIRVIHQQRLVMI
ncbi:Guanine nucleotide-exchange protein [Musa troglodytarum]|uniref:Guanine nucleotide-exchange protein n=1 Tax=Musa troglodytarum TaxID=320322 RepID=A0A9E7ERX9_9LILI|nr:Guanine nucleotide-exchange protein [Musa troglodytarum]